MFRRVTVHAKTFPCRESNFSLQSNVPPVASYELTGRTSILGRVRNVCLFHYIQIGLLSLSYRELLPQGKSGKGVKLTIHPHIIVRSKRSSRFSAMLPISLPGV
jgi:hypothetical protein